MTWYRCEKHGSYNVDGNTPLIRVRCPSCEREEAEYRTRRRRLVAAGKVFAHRGCRRPARERWEAFLDRCRRADE